MLNIFFSFYCTIKVNHIPTSSFVTLLLFVNMPKKKKEDIDWEKKERKALELQRLGRERRAPVRTLFEKLPPPPELPGLTPLSASSSTTTTTPSSEEPPKRRRITPQLIAPLPPRASTSTTTTTTTTRTTPKTTPEFDAKPTAKKTTTTRARRVPKAATTTPRRGTRRAEQVGECFGKTVYKGPRRGTFIRKNNRNVYF